MRKKVFCIECRKETDYALQKKSVAKTVKGIEYLFNITVAICNECGEEMSIPGLIDRNIKEVDEQYRAYEGIVSIDDVKKLMDVYQIGKDPLSLALGFGQVTIARYLLGQVPSKEYSNVIKSALSSPKFMIKKLSENKEKISATAYKKAMNSALQLKNLFSVSDKMLWVISRIFNQLEEVTPLMLQKLLYLIQGESYSVNGKPMFAEDCQAWVHGPVYPEVYEMFRDFKYNPIDDARFAIFEGADDKLSECDRQIIDLALDVFGEYGGKVLEKITHQQTPWKLARKGYADDIRSNEIITKESIKNYYSEKNAEYDFSSEKGIKKYLSDIL